MRVLFATPAFRPAVGFGGPIAMATALTEGLVRLGHDVTVVTTSLRAIQKAPDARFRTRHADISGVRVVYLATPLRYRWMGFTPTLPLELARGLRPDVVHAFGFRDMVTTTAAVWAHAAGVPYVFEPLGMLEPRLRKAQLKHVLDATLFHSVPVHARLVVATSEAERRQIVGTGVAAERVEIRSNGFPDPDSVPRGGGLRERLGIADAPLVLYVGRLSRGKGIEFLLELARARRDVHVALVGPDDGHGVGEEADRTGANVHVVGAVADPLGLYADADVFVLPSSSESFGMAAAEAAAAGVASVVTDRCGVAEFLGDAAVVVPYDATAVASAVTRLLDDAALRAQLGERAVAAARRQSWAAMVERQEALYELAIERG